MSGKSGAIAAAWIAAAAAVVAAAVGLLQPVVGKWTADPTPTVPPEVPCAPVLLVETFEDEATIDTYVKTGLTEARHGRLRFSMEYPHMGDEIPMFGEYEAFTLVFKMYPVGEISDGSVNVAFLTHSDGRYEILLRPRTHEYGWMKYKGEQGSREFVTGQGWVTSEAVTLGTTYTLIRLDVIGGKFTMWVNGAQVAILTDEDPYLRGGIALGIGAGDKSPISFEIDEVYICGL